MTSNDSLSTGTWTIGLSARGTTTTLTVSRDITVKDLLRRIATATNVSHSSLRVLCGGVLIKATDAEDAVALEKHSVLKDGVTFQIMGDEPRVPQATRDLWREVSRGLVRSQIIVWKYAVESLAAAKEHFTDDEARNFVHTHLCDIVTIMSAQNPSKIGTLERNCVQETLQLAAEILSMDLRIESSGHLLKSLGFLFDPKQTYMAEMAKRSGQPDPAVGQATVSGIATFFSKLDGFINLATFMAEHVGTSSFPNPRVVAQVVGLLPMVATGPDTKVPTLQDKAAVTVIVKASLDHISTCNDDYLREIAGNVNILKRLRQALLKAVRNEAITTDRDEAQLWDSLSSLVLRMIDTKLPLAERKGGWAAWHDLMEWSVEALHSNEKLIVNGAGKSFVNGVYTPTKTNGELRYTRIVPDGTTLTCFRCTMRNHKRWWFISKADSEQPGTDKDVDYYLLKIDDLQCTPRLNGWIVAKTHGVAPAPTLELAGTLDLPEKEARELPPFRFCRWAQENGLLTRAESDDAYSEFIVEKKKPRTTMYDLLSLLRYGMSEEARGFGLLADVRFEELHREMTTCKKATDVALKCLKSSNSHIQFGTAIKTLEQIMEKILTKKNDKYRKIKVQNAQFRQKLGGRHGADQLMKAVGFSRNQGSDGVEVYSFSGSVFGLLAVYNSLDEFLKITRQIVRRISNAAEIEIQMIETAIRRSLADAGGNRGGQPGE